MVLEWHHHQTRSERAALSLSAGETHRGPTHLCREALRALQTSSKQKALWSEERKKREGGREREYERGGRLSRFIARSREASTEHSFNQTVTSPPGAAQRLENRSLRGFCSHAPRLSSERSAGSSESVASYPGDNNKTDLMSTRYETEHGPLL